jgi:hypothetical protein
MMIPNPSKSMNTTAITTATARRGVRVARAVVAASAVVTGQWWSRVVL